MVCPALFNKENILSAHSLIQQYIHRTPVLTSETLNQLASTPQTAEALIGTQFEGQQPANPKLNFFFKCENFQRAGTIKTRGTVYAVLRLIKAYGIEAVRKKGVVTHSFGNHGQALALTAQMFGIPAYIIVHSPETNIDALISYGATVEFSDPTNSEREDMVENITRETAAFFVPSTNHPDIILGQGTVGLELEEQVRELVLIHPQLSIHRVRGSGRVDPGIHKNGRIASLDAIITSTSDGGLEYNHSACLTSRPGTSVFGAEPSCQGCDGLAALHRTKEARTLRAGGGMEEPPGEILPDVIFSNYKVHSVYAVSKEHVNKALKMVLEEMGVMIEPSAAVGLAAALYNEDFRRMVEQEEPAGWNIGIVFTGGNVMIEDIIKLCK